MATLDEIGQQKERLAGRLAKLDEERAKLAEQLSELEIAERVLARFGGVGAAPGRRGRRGARAAGKPAPKPAGRRAAPRRTRARRDGAGQSLSLSDAALKAVGEHPDGIVANELLQYLAKKYGLVARPNHLGIALQRHRRAGRLESRDSRWFLPRSVVGGTASGQSEAFPG